MRVKLIDKYCFYFCACSLLQSLLALNRLTVYVFSLLCNIHSFHVCWSKLKWLSLLLYFGKIHLFSLSVVRAHTHFFLSFFCQAWHLKLLCIKLSQFTELYGTNNWLFGTTSVRFSCMQNAYATLVSFLSCYESLFDSFGVIFWVN